METPVRHPSGSEAALVPSGAPWGWGPICPLLSPRCLCGCGTSVPPAVCSLSWARRAPHRQPACLPGPLCPGTELRRAAVSPHTHALQATGQEAACLGVAAAGWLPWGPRFVSTGPRDVTGLTEDLLPGVPSKGSRVAFPIRNGSWPGVPSLSHLITEPADQQRARQPPLRDAASF